MFHLFRLVGTTYQNILKKKQSSRYDIDKRIIIVVGQSPDENKKKYVELTVFLNFKLLWNLFFSFCKINELFSNRKLRKSQWWTFNSNYFLLTRHLTKLVYMLMKLLQYLEYLIRFFLKTKCWLNNQYSHKTLVFHTAIRDKEYIFCICMLNIQK